MSKLSEWLEAAGLSELHDVLTSADVDFDLLPNLTDGDMRELGLSLGQRKRFGSAIAELRAKPSGSRDARPAPLAGSAERRRLTVMFIDLVGSTELSRQLDVEDMRGVITSYQKCCTELIEKNGGIVAKYMGDGVLAYFGYPLAEGYAAENALRAGLGVVDAVGKLRPLPGSELHCRIGVATGLTIVGDLIGTGASAENQVLGDTPNLAARLQSLALPDTMIVSQKTREIVGPHFECEAQTAEGLKGFDDPVTCYRVIAEREIGNRFLAARDGMLLAPLEGRADEFTRLCEAWKIAGEGGFAAVLMVGDAGLGKSRLLAELEGIATESAGLVAYFACQPQFSNSTLMPVRTFLSQHARFERQDSAADRYAKLSAFLAGFEMADKAPLVATMLELPPGDVYAPPVETPLLQRQSFYKLMAELVLAMAAGKPLLLLVEDLHWADASTLEFLNSLPVALTDKGAMLAATSRPEGEGVLAETYQVSKLEIGPLSEAAVRALAEHAAGRQILPGQLIEHVHKKAGGNPLFVEELTKALLDSDRVREVGGDLRFENKADDRSIPDTLYDLLMARLDRLGEAKDYALISSAIGNEFGLSLLADVCQCAAPDVQAAMSRLEDARVVFPYTVQGEQFWSFRHALVQEAAYNSMLRSRRSGLHKAIAASISRVTPQFVIEHPEVVAHHFGRAGEHRRAIELGRAAGLNALVRSANAEAVEHTGFCLEWLEQLEESPERDITELGITALRTPAILQHKGYTSPEIEALSQRVSKLLDRVGDRPEAFPNILGLKVFHHVRSERQRARALAQRFIDLAEGLGDTSTLVAGLPMLAQCCWIEGKHAEAEALLRRGIELYDAEQHGMHAAQYGFDTLSYCRMTLSQVLWITGRVSQAVDEAQAALDHARKVKHTNTIGLAMLYVAMLLQLRGERAATAKFVGEASAYCDKMGVSTPTSYIAMIANWAAGNVDASLQLFEIHGAMGAHLGLTYYRSLPVEILIAAGDYARASEVLAPALQQTETTGERYWLPRLLILKAQIAKGLGKDNVVALLDDAAARARADGALMLEAQALAELVATQPKNATREHRDRLSALTDDLGVELSGRLTLA